MTNEEKNYRKLVDKAELAFLNKRYLEAFLIQSCLFESVTKSFAYLFLKSTFESNQTLKQKSNNFELARLTDELFIAGKITQKTYDNLDNYRKKRNKIIHQILNFKDIKIFEKELKKTYEAGRDMKGFIVDQMIESKKGKTMEELASNLESSLREWRSEADIIIPKFLKRNSTEFNKNIKKLGININP